MSLCSLPKLLLWKLLVPFSLLHWSSTLMLLLIHNYPHTTGEPKTQCTEYRTQIFVVDPEIVQCCKHWGDIIFSCQQNWLLICCLILQWVSLYVTRSPSCPQMKWQIYPDFVTFHTDTERQKSCQIEGNHFIFQRVCICWTHAWQFSCEKLKAIFLKS